MQRPAELFLEKFTTQQEDSLAKLHIVRSLAFFKSYPTLKNDIPYTGCQPNNEGKHFKKRNFDQTMADRAKLTPGGCSALLVA